MVLTAIDLRSTTADDLIGEPKKVEGILHDL